MHDTADIPLPLLTPDQREQLLANGRESGRDHVPVVKFFNPVGGGTWLATELYADQDTCFGLADIGFPELGTFSLEELAALQLPFGMYIERDVFFTDAFPISAYAEAAHQSAATKVSGHYSNGAILSGYGCEAIKTQCIAAGLPVIDSRCVAFDVVVHLTLGGPLVAVGRDPDPAPWHGLSYAPLQAVAVRYAAAGAAVWNVTGAETMPALAERRTAP